MSKLFHVSEGSDFIQPCLDWSRLPHGPSVVWLVSHFAWWFTLHDEIVTTSLLLWIFFLVVFECLLFIWKIKSLSQTQSCTPQSGKKTTTTTFFAKGVHCQWKHDHFWSFSFLIQRKPINHCRMLKNNVVVEGQAIFHTSCFSLACILVSTREDWASLKDWNLVLVHNQQQSDGNKINIQSNNKRCAHDRFERFKCMQIEKTGRKMFVLK